MIYHYTWIKVELKDEEVILIVKTYGGCINAKRTTSVSIYSIQCHSLAY